MTITTNCKELFVIVTAPYTVTDEPLAAPAILDSILKQYYDVKFIDLNAEFNLAGVTILSEYFLNGIISQGWSDIFSKYINDCVDRVGKLNPIHLGLV